MEKYFENVKDWFYLINTYSSNNIDEKEIQKTFESNTKSFEKFEDKNLYYSLISGIVFMIHEIEFNLDGACNSKICDKILSTTNLDELTKVFGFASNLRRISHFDFDYLSIKDTVVAEYAKHNVLYTYGEPNIEINTSYKWTPNEKNITYLYSSNELKEIKKTIDQKEIEKFRKIDKNTELQFINIDGEQLINWLEKISINEIMNWYQNYSINDFLEEWGLEDIKEIENF
ncbi:Hypothetical protein MAU_4140 [Metamycoplasma auris 15026]|uniref:Uncharacterized protein n=1 Tax=Metamycoplasma auris 15026 TaxID=1188233 RepID=N9TRB6_9BACT|nr:hypothetical protein [Metamycoplasma auris]ENY68625.1 Hypothetical protein MAU_4140 [Metamycoplasma auris 15026]